MASFNLFTGVGNVTRDPEGRQAGASTVVGFGLAINRRYTTKGGEAREDVTFLDCEAWGKQGEVILKYVTKGKPLLVSGRLTQDKWEDKQGNKREKIKLVVENFQFLGAPGGGDGEEREHPVAAKATAAKATARDFATGPFPDEGPDDSIPF